MKKALKFHQALKAVIDRAAARHRLATGQPLALPKIAQETGLELSALTRTLRGEMIPGIGQLLPLLIYLGCDEAEQRFLFHLSELSLPKNMQPGIEAGTDELAASAFSFPDDTEPGLERITEQHPRF